MAIQNKKVKERQKTRQHQDFFHVSIAPSNLRRGNFFLVENATKTSSYSIKVKRSAITIV